MIRKLVIVVLCTWFAGALSASIVDLTTSGASGYINDALFMQIDPGGSAGTGVFDAFLRIQGPQVEEGYNTDGATEFQTKTGSWTHSLNINDIPIVVNGGDIEYREFALDINQNTGDAFSLDELRIYLEPTAALSGYPDSFNNLIYDMDAAGESWVLMNYSLNAGSGQGDIVVCIPDALFSGSNEYVYLYSKFGEHGGANDGFEEWGVGVGGSIIPEPSTVMLLGLGAGLFLRKRK